MTILEIIQTRRTIYDFIDKPVDEALIKDCLNAAIWAPNHKMTEPWRFWVLGDNTQELLAKIYAENRAKKKYEPNEKGFQSAFEKALKKFISIPKIILVGQMKSNDPVVKLEDFAACSCAIQNFQLTAWEKKLGVQWSTGPIINDKRTFTMLDIEEENVSLIGALYVGYPACIPSGTRKKTVEEVSQWLK